jgi:hypothetical protein
LYGTEYAMSGMYSIPRRLASFEARAMTTIALAVAANSAQARTRASALTAAPL